MFSTKGLGDILPAQLPSSGFDDLAREFSIPEEQGEDGAGGGISTSTLALSTPQGYQNPTYQSAPSPGQRPPGQVNPGNLSTYAVPYGAPLVPQHGQVLPGVPFGYQQGATLAPMQRATLGNDATAAKGSWWPWAITFVALGAVGGLGYLMYTSSKKGPR